MSGGVDSSLTLRLLANLPLNLTVLFMRNWDPLLSEESTDSSRDAGSSRQPNMSPCAWERDWADVKRVCAHVGIPERDISLLDLSKEYWSRVFEPAVAVWEAGQTPNPDVACNREIKFGALMQHIKPGHYLATGHYARVVRSDASHATLHRAIDSNKDQTYYLSQVPGHQLAKAVFPLAGIPKPSVRELAAHFELPTATREESMGVCFIGERGHFGDFVSQYTSPPSTTGYLVDTAGKRYGAHRGSHYYTIGQRARVGGMDGRWFVAQKGVGENGNDILLVQGADHPALQCKELDCGEFNWIAGVPPPEMDGSGVLDAMVQVRHRMSAVPAQRAHHFRRAGGRRRAGADRGRVERRAVPRERADRHHEVLGVDLYHLHHYLHHSLYNTIDTMQSLASARFLPCLSPPFFLPSMIPQSSPTSPSLAPPSLQLTFSATHISLI
ncbi:hypothetical protein VHUM_00422 [Vanrija humicola]|uniref:tRNA-5-taurinomethyluridine 2-sulfurtransferase n=1 Tax=Vanrija humicola TaxID=5417 RepID=A0A7D8Z488_VANHU|nr:hypothetical protein VHUM_00422 [Vanrija humicola]